MATFDEMMVRFLFDTSDLEKGAKRAEETVEKTGASVAAAAGKGEKAQTEAAGRIVKALERIADQGDKLAGAQEQQHKKVAEATNKTTVNVEALARKFLSLYALVTAGRGLREFVSDLTSTDSALGRTAKNIDLGAKALSTWQLAAEASGGSAAGITGVMRSLSGELQRAALTGTSSIIPAFKALGINLATTGGKARDVRDILTDMNRRAQGMDPAKFTALANLAGISDEGTISMLEMRTAEFDKLIAAQEKYAATQADVDAAQKRQSGWRELLITSTSIGRTILTAVTPAIVAMMKAVQDWANGKDWTKLSKPISDFLETLTNADWKGFIGQAEDFATKVRDIVTAADAATKGIDGNSALFKGLEALGVLIGVRVLGSVLGLTAELGKLGNIPVPAWFLKMAGIAAIPALAAEAQRVHPLDVVKSKDPVREAVEELDPARLWGGDPKGVRDRAAAGDTRSWWQRVAPKMLGGLDDPKVRENVEATAKSTAGIFDLMRNGAAGTGPDGTGGGAGGTMGGVNRVLGWAGRAMGGRPGRGDGAPLHFAGLGNGGWEKSGANKQEVADYIKYAAAKAGVDPETALRVSRSEDFNTYVGDYGTSFGPFQLHYGGSGIRGMNSGGLGDSFTKETGLDARDPKTWKAQVDYAMKMAKREGWGAWHGARAVGIGNRQGLDYHGPVPPAPASTSAGAGVPAPSAGAVSDAEVQAARQRILNGSRDPRDTALVGRYLKEQNTPPSPALPAQHDKKPAGAKAKAVRTVDIPETSPSEPWHQSPLQYTKGDGRNALTNLYGAGFAGHHSGSTPHLAAHYALHRALVALGRANRLTAHGSGPVPVDVTERSAERIGRSSRHHRSHVHDAMQRAMQHTSGLHHILRTAAASPHMSRSTANHIDRSSTSTTTIHGMTVQTRATDGRELMADLDRHLARNREVPQFNSGLA